MKSMILALVLLTTAVSAQEAAKPASVECRAVLRNGSVIKGRLKPFETVTVKTEYGNLKIPIKSLAGIGWGDVKKEEADVVAARDQSFRGWVQAMPDLEINVGESVVNVAAASLKSLRVWDEKTSGDDFELGALDQWTRTGHCKWSAKGGKLHANHTAEFHSLLIYNESFDGKYTVEADVLANNHVAMLWNLDEETGNGMTVWLNTNDITVWEGANMITRFQVALPAGEVYRVKLDVDGGRTTISINGTETGSCEYQLRGGKAGFNCYRGNATFDNFKVRRG